MAAVWFKAGNHQTVLFQPCFFLVTCILWHAEFCCNIYCDLSPCCSHGPRVIQTDGRMLPIGLHFIYLSANVPQSLWEWLQSVQVNLPASSCSLSSIRRMCNGFPIKWSRVLQLGPMLYQFFLPTASLNWSDGHFHKNCPSALTLKGNLHFQFVSHLFQLYCCLVSS